MRTFYPSDVVFVEQQLLRTTNHKHQVQWLQLHPQTTGEGGGVAAASLSMFLISVWWVETAEGAEPPGEQQLLGAAPRHASLPHVKGEGRQRRPGVGRSLAQV